MPNFKIKIFMLIDDVKIELFAGRGGKGAVSFSSAKNTYGPTGGSGGNGGSIFFEGVSDISALGQFRFKKEIHAEDGKDGQPRLKDGKRGDDLILKSPLGTVVRNFKDTASYEIMEAGKRILAMNGGQGGKGNFFFRSSKNTTPTKFQPGLPGESGIFKLELKFIADVGFIGLPNVGKSSLLNELANTKSKVANYHFTTLEPNLGMYYNLILADIPGLIEGASKGKGLGIKFLRHIERTKILFHFIAADSVDPVADYKTARNEMGKYNKLLLEKPEYLFLSKKDVISPDTVVKMTARLKKLNKNATPISIFDWDSIELVKKIINDLILDKAAFKYEVPRRRSY